MTDEQLISVFESCSLLIEQWNHRSHVRIAYLYSLQFDLHSAISRMRAGIKAYNTASNTPEAIDRGYHETITVAFMHLIFAASREGASFKLSSDEFCDGHPELLAKTVLLEYYSRDCLLTWQAKSEFVEPDIAALPGTTAKPAGKERRKTVGQ